MRALRTSYGLYKNNFFFGLNLNLFLILNQKDIFTLHSSVKVTVYLKLNCWHLLIKVAGVVIITWFIPASLPDLCVLAETKFQINI